MHFRVALTIVANCFCSPNGDRLIIDHYPTPVGFIEIHDQMRGIAVIGSDHIHHKMRAFLVIEDRPPLSSCPPKTETDSLQKIGMK
jgi:hypothetical protein